LGEIYQDISNNGNFLEEERRIHGEFGIMSDGE